MNDIVQANGEYDQLTDSFQKKLRKLAAMRGPSTRSLRCKAYEFILGTDIEPAIRQQAARFLIRECRDLYFWFTYILRRKDGRIETYITLDKDKGTETLVDTPTWVYARCNELTDEPNERLDLWAREHYKSSIGTFALTLMEVACNPEITIGVFSFRSKSANDFISQYKSEMEINPLLHWLFPDVFWENPQREAPQWSTQAGLTVKRVGNPRSATLEAHALEQGAPVGKHYDGRVYDDVVTRDSVIGDAPIRALTAWELSLSLGKVGGWSRYYGTRYAYNDTYGIMIQRGAVKARIHEAEQTVEWCDIDTKELNVDRTTAFMPLELLDKKRRDMQLATYSCQMLLDPRGGGTAMFNIQNIRYFDHVIPRQTVNVYILVDPAKGKGKRKTRSDFTCMQVWATAADQNFYLLDMIHDRLSLEQRTSALIQLYQQWKPNAVGYEEYGMQADIEHIESECRRLTYHIPITPLGGNTLTKEDRIERIIPYVDQRRIFLPARLIRARNGEEGTVDLINYFVNVEMANWPAVVHDDALDIMARLTDPAMGIVFPDLAFGANAADIYRQNDDTFSSGGWMRG